MEIEAETAKTKAMAQVVTGLTLENQALGKQRDSSREESEKLASALNTLEQKLHQTAEDKKLIMVDIQQLLSRCQALHGQLHQAR